MGFGYNWLQVPIKHIVRRSLMPPQFSASALTPSTFGE